MSINFVKMRKLSKIFHQFCKKLVGTGSKNRRIMQMRRNGDFLWVESYQVKINEILKWIRIACQFNQSKWVVRLTWQKASKCEICQSFSINFGTNRRIIRMRRNGDFELIEQMDHRKKKKIQNPNQSENESIEPGVKMINYPSLETQQLKPNLNKRENKTRSSLTGLFSFSFCFLFFFLTIRKRKPKNKPEGR